jgi:hypothetical protein
LLLVEAEHRKRRKNNGLENREQYEGQLKNLQDAYGEAMQQLSARQTAVRASDGGHDRRDQPANRRGGSRQFDQSPEDC